MDGEAAKPVVPESENKPSHESSESGHVMVNEHDREPEAASRDSDKEVPPNPESSPSDRKSKEQSAESLAFSKALNARVAKIEKKYADYEQLKEKAQQVDILQQKVAELEKVQQVQAEIVDVAKQSKLSERVVSVLADTQSPLAERAEALYKLVYASAPKSYSARATGGGEASAMDLLRQAYRQ